MTRHERIRLLALFILSFGLRLSLIGKGSYHFDCLELLMASENTMASHQLQYMHGPGYPLMVLIGVVFLKLFNPVFHNPVLAINLIGVVFTSLSVVVLYFCCRRLFNPKAAFYASLAFSFFPIVLSVSVYGINIGVSLLFAFIALLFMLRYLEDSGKRQLAFAGFFMGAVAVVRLPDILFLAPLLFLLFTGKKGWRAETAASAFSFFPSFFILPALLYMPMMLWGSPDSMIRALGNASSGKFLGLFSPLLPLSAENLIHSVSAPLFISSVFWALPKLMVKNRRYAFFLLLWFAVMFFYYANVGCVEPRYLAIAAVPLAILFGWLLAAIPVAGIRLLVLITAVVSMAWSILPVVWVRHARDMQESYARWVKGQTPVTAAIIAKDEQIFLRRYSGREILHIPDDSGEIANARFFSMVDRLLDEGREVFIIKSALIHPEWESRLGEGYRFKKTGEMLNQDWHQKCLKTGVFVEELYQIRKREAPAIPVSAP